MSLAQGSSSSTSSETLPDDGTAVGPVTVAVGATLATVTFVAYSVRPPSRSMIAAVMSSVAGPSAVSASGSVTVAPPGSNVPSSSRSYS